MSGAAQITPQPQNSTSDAGRSDITRAIERAAEHSHTPFATLVAIAGAESGFRADAQSRYSSAAGPFQITESTWLHLVKTYGAAAGRADLAALVRQNADGVLSVAPEDKAQVLGARHDAALSSQLAARFCDECRNSLAKKLGRPPTEEDVRLAYFLGVNGATRLMRAAAARPGETVKALLPSAFANHRHMLSHHGRPLNAEQAFASLESRFSAQIAQSRALKSYAGANALAADVATAATAEPSTVELASADAVFAAAADAASSPAAAPTTAVAGDAPATVTADAVALAPVALAEAPMPTEAPPAPVQTAANVADVEKPLACMPAADGGVTCAL